MSQKTHNCPKGDSRVKCCVFCIQHCSPTLTTCCKHDDRGPVRLKKHIFLLNLTKMYPCVYGCFYDEERQTNSDKKRQTNSGNTPVGHIRGWMFRLEDFVLHRQTKTHVVMSR